MRKQKRTAPWIVLLQGLAAALAIYGIGILALTALILYGGLPESMSFPMIAAAGVFSVLAGGVLCLRRLPWGSLTNAMAMAVLFAAALLVVGLSLGSVNWAGEGGGLLICLMGTGLLTGLLGSRKHRRSRKLHM